MGAVISLELAVQQRLNAPSFSPEAFQFMMNLEKYLASCGLARTLIHLVKLRASQINGCAFCIEMHTREATKDGELVTRLLLLDAWRESSAFTDVERAALAWTEALTLITEGHAPDDVYRELGEHFSEQEMVDLTFVITTINAWNRLAIGFRYPHPAVV